jgi:flagellar protein FliO/FliZ
MQWLGDLPFVGSNPVLQVGFLAACGIAALVVLAVLYRFVFAHRLRVPGGRTRQPRLGLVDAFSLDGQRQLVLVRRDNVEHLIMIGGPNDVLVESQINRALAASRENNSAPVAQASLAQARRVEPVAVAPAAPVAPPPAAKAKPAPQQAQPAAAAAPVPTAEVRPIRAQAFAPAPTSSTPEAPPSVQPEPVSQPLAAAKAAEPTTPIQSRPLPRPLPGRAAMPSPITPTTAPAARATVTRLPEKPQGVSPGLSAPDGAPAAPVRSEPVNAPPRQPIRVAPAPIPATLVKVATPAPAPPEPLMISKPEAPVIAKPEAPMIAKAEVNLQPPAPVADAVPPADKSAPQSEDPFGGLESLEAEMARLLGRD